ncbi:hypothetical protein Bca101_069444 [Brassica carinata]
MSSGGEETELNRLPWSSSVCSNSRMRLSWIQEGGATEGGVVSMSLKCHECVKAWALMNNCHKPAEDDIYNNRDTGRSAVELSLYRLLSSREGSEENLSLSTKMTELNLPERIFALGEEPAGEITHTINPKELNPFSKLLILRRSRSFQCYKSQLWGKLILAGMMRWDYSERSVSAPIDEADNVINKTILTKILNQPVGNGDAAVARKKMANNMVEEEGLHNITAHGTTTSPLTKHMDESSGDNPEEMHVQNDYEVTLPPLCIEAMDSTTQFSRTHARLERAREIETFRLYSMTTTVIPRSKCFQVKTPTMLTKHTFLSEISWGRTRLSRLQTEFGYQARICVISPKVHSNFSSNAAGVIYSCSVSKL